MGASPAAVDEFGAALAGLGWITDLHVAGSLATGDYVPQVSDLDLVAVADGPVDPVRQTTLAHLHRQIDRAAPGLALGCVYVDAARIPARQARHPTWTHGRLVQRILSGITRAELVRHGYALFGRAPRDVFPAMTDDDVRTAAAAELTGYWAWATRRPWLWLNSDLAELGLTSMARGRYAMDNGELLDKTRAVELADAPGWLVGQLRARRRGEKVRLPRVRAGLIAWRDARRTVARAACP
jgi:hypothetical protein